MGGINTLVLGLLNSTLLSFKFLREKVSLNNMNPTTFDLNGIASFNCTLLFGVRSQSDKGGTFAKTRTSLADLGVEDCEAFENVLHILLLCDEWQVSHSNSQVRHLSVGIGSLLAVHRSTRGRRRGNVSRATRMEALTIEGLTRIRTETRRITIHNASLGKLRGRLCTLDLKVTTVKRLCIEFLNDLIHLVLVLKGYESSSLGTTIISCEDVDVVYWGYRFDMTSKSKLTSAVAKATNKNLSSVVISHFLTSTQTKNLQQSTFNQQEPQSDKSIRKGIPLATKSHYLIQL